MNTSTRISVPFFATTVIMHTYNDVDYFIIFASRLWYMHCVTNFYRDIFCDIHFPHNFCSSEYATLISLHTFIGAAFTTQIISIKPDYITG